MTAIELKDEQLTAIVAQSILQALTPDTREKLITNAISELLCAKNSGSYGQPNELQKIFNRAVEHVASNIVVKQLESDETFNTQIKELLSQVSVKFFDENQREQLVATLVKSLHSALNSNRY